MLRTGLLVVACLSILLTGGVCVPLFSDSREPPAGTLLAVAVKEPASDRTIAQGDVLRIEYSITNSTGEDAIVTIAVDRSSDRSVTLIKTDTIASGTTTTRGVDWDAEGFESGEYRITVRAIAGGRESQASSLGRISVDAPASFSFRAPSGPTRLPADGTLNITWNIEDPEGDATVSLLLDPDDERDSGNEIALANDLPSSQDSFEWDGRDADADRIAAGVYALVAIVDDPRNPAATFESTSEITIENGPPSLAFTSPTENVMINAGEAVDIAWTVSDAEGDDAFVTILFDDDPDDNDDDDETPATAIVTRQQDADGTGTAEWDTGGVEPGTWFIHARVEDDASEITDFVVAMGSVMITNDAPTIEFTSPEEDTDFLGTEPALDIELTVTDDDSVLLDLIVDTDDDHANGNEQTILLQRLVESDDAEQTLEWDGETWDDMPVANGIYVLLAIADDGTNPPVMQALSGAMIFRRAKASDPLIALLEPAAALTVDPGDTVTIRWRDDTPEEGALVSIVVDDDAVFGEMTETDEPPLEILTDRDGNGDDLLDRFSWRVPELDPGTYYIFASITKEDASDRNTSRARGTVIVRDPAGETP
jgi:hypothetical protein